MEAAKQEKIKALREKAMKLPLSPGVYIMHNKSGDTIYIGKAKALKNRVSQYFGSGRSHDEKVKSMVMNVEYFEYIVTDSEFEALVLESSLIKQRQPKYNILLKDDKGYSYIRIGTQDWPKITEVKKIENDNAKYFGPYMSAWTVKETIDSAVKIFKLPTCNRSFPDDFGKGRPCLNYHIKQCCAPCSGKISHDQYMEAFSQAVEYIKGGSETSIPMLEKNMEKAAENLDFELAARLRDRIKSIERVRQRQKVMASREPEQDIIAMAQGERVTSFEVFRFTSGRLSDRENFITQGVVHDAESRSEFIRQYYTIRDRIPPVIVTDGEIEDMELVLKWLSDKRGRKVRCNIPQAGAQYKLVQMCKTNAAESLAQYLGNTGGREASELDEIKRLLGLSKVPAYIEAYDISNLMGGENVGGMVVFQNARPLKQAYRRFKIKTVVGQDDYASMQEMIIRRMEEYKQSKSGDGFGRLPDLILLDGGKGHVGVVKPIVDSYGYDIPVFGMVKDNKHRTRAIAQSGGEIAINSKRRAFTLISSIQDEVHRYAISYHRNLRKKNTISMSLLSIDSIGEARAKALLKHFKTIKAIGSASQEELKSIKGMTKQAAQAVYDYFNNESS